MKEDGRTMGSKAQGPIGFLTVAGTKASGAIMKRMVEECSFT